MNYDVMSREDLESELNDLLYWLFETGCDHITFHMGAHVVTVKLSDLSEISFTSCLPFEL